MKRNAKSILTLLLALVMVLSLFAACDGSSQTTEPSEAASNEPVKLWYGYNTENFMQDLEYEDQMEERDYTLRMYGIRDDVESIQLMITPDVNVVSFDFAVEDLKSEDGATFAAENIEIFAEWYVEVNESYNMDSYYGYYPDALVPLENFKLLHHNSIDAGQNQGIWINANIPADQTAGFYTGTGVLTVDGEQYNVPIELTVYDAVMPEENHQPSSFAIWYDYIVYGEGEYSTELADEYFWFLVDKRVMPLDPDPSKRADYDVYVNWLVETQVENPKIASYGLPYKTEHDEDGNKIVSRSGIMSLLSKMAEKNIELREAGNEDVDLFKKAFYYLGGICDEPTGPMLQVVRNCDLVISQCKIAIADTYFKGKYQDLYESCMALRHVVTTGYNTELLGSDTTGGVQTWCPQFQHWQSESQRQEYYNRQNTTDRLMGEDAWWYGCNNPKAPYPTYHLDDDMIASRVISWMQFDYNVDGDLYWLVNNYKGYDMWSVCCVAESAGEGNLLYPGSKYGIFGPLSTLRLESIREGREDYECFWLMEQAILAYNEANGTSHDPEALMEPLYADLYDGVIPVRDNADVFVERRITMLDILEQLTLDPAAGIAALEALA